MNVYIAIAMYICVYVCIYDFHLHRKTMKRCGSWIAESKVAIAVGCERQVNDLLQVAALALCCVLCVSRGASMRQCEDQVILYITHVALRD